MRFMKTLWRTFWLAGAFAFGAVAVALSFIATIFDAADDLRNPGSWPF